MLDPNLLNYIKSNLEKGASKEAISEKLIEAGWQASQVKEAFGEVSKNNLQASTGAGFAAVDNLDIKKDEKNWLNHLKRIDVKKVVSVFSFLFALSLIVLLFYAQAGTKERKEKVVDVLNVISMEDEDQEYSLSLAGGLADTLEKEIEKDEVREEHDKMMEEIEWKVLTQEERTNLQKLELIRKKTVELLEVNSRREELKSLISKNEFSLDKAKTVISECSSNDDCSAEVVEILKGQSLVYKDLLDYNLTISIDDIEQSEEGLDLYSLTVANDEVSFSCKTELDIAYGLIFSVNLAKRPVNYYFFFDYLNKVFSKDKVTFICEKEEDLLAYFKDKSFLFMVRPVINVEDENYDGILCEDINCLIDASQDCSPARYIYKYIDSGEIKTEQIDIYNGVNAPECIVKGIGLETDIEEKNDFECTNLTLSLSDYLSTVRNSGDLEFNWLKSHSLNCK